MLILFALVDGISMTAASFIEHTSEPVERSPFLFEIVLPMCDAFPLLLAATLMWLMASSPRRAMLWDSVQAGDFNRLRRFTILWPMTFTIAGILLQLAVQGLLSIGVSIYNAWYFEVWDLGRPFWYWVHSPVPSMASALPADTAAGFLTLWFCIRGLAIGHSPVIVTLFASIVGMAFYGLLSVLTEAWNTQKTPVAAYLTWYGLPAIVATTLFLLILVYLRRNWKPLAIRLASGADPD